MLDKERTQSIDVNIRELGGLLALGQSLLILCANNVLFKLRNGCWHLMLRKHASQFSVRCSDSELVSAFDWNLLQKVNVALSLLLWLGL